ncbi:(2Fe-2S)-binding protein [Streptomyces spiralis]|uniref:(2Fe-2S)-binding protein n=1 Tax=Streptomyces spiralis TaxID=66376 RepID=A0A918ZNI2_9ACTN|nr:(2Fe-2S)-binding protein [Streptomyces spiralis]GHE61934.1 (2Fe-2S)-binding protein [Streptomyces spiralis]
MTTPIPLELSANGAAHTLAVDPRRSLADVLRRDLGLTGTTVGCETGVCGSCTVLVNGEPVRSCLMLAAQADGTAVETVESLAENDPTSGRLNPLQRSFKENFALQCGFCTPGFLMLGTALLRKEPTADRARITECVAANLCRCTGYAAIVDAVEAATRTGDAFGPEDQEQEGADA